MKKLIFNKLDKDTFVVCREPDGFPYGQIYRYLGKKFHFDSRKVLMNANELRQIADKIDELTVGKPNGD